MGEFFKFVFRFFHGWQRKTAATALVLILISVWTRGFFVDSRPINVDPLGKDDAIAGIGSENTTVDWTKYEWVLIDPTTGSRTFSINGSPVQGKLKAYLEDPATWEGGDMICVKDHPDGESNTWVMIPKPLFLSLTDQSPPVSIETPFLENSGNADELYHELTSHSNGNAVVKELLESIFHGISRDLLKETSYKITSQRDDNNNRHIRVRLEQRIEIEPRLDERGQEGWYTIAIGDQAHFTEARIGLENSDGQAAPVLDLSDIGDQVCRVVLIDRDTVPISAEFQSGSTTESRHARLKDLASFGPRLPDTVSSSIEQHLAGPEKGKVIVEVRSKEIELTIVRGTPWVLQFLQLVGT